MKKAGLLCGIILNFLSLSAYADILVDNQSNSSITGKASFLCSTDIPRGGVLEPHHSVNIPQDMVDTLCKKSCTVTVHANRSCSKKIGTVKVSKGNVSSVSTDNSYGLKLSQNGNNVIITGPDNSWLHLFNFFS